MKQTTPTEGIVPTAKARVGSMLLKVSKTSKRLFHKPALNSSYLLMRLKIHRNEALESMARETVMTGVKHTSVRTCGLLHIRN